jgi:hypothetical protein
MGLSIKRLADVPADLGGDVPDLGLAPPESPPVVGPNGSDPRYQGAPVQGQMPGSPAGEVPATPEGAAETHYSVPFTPPAPVRSGRLTNARAPRRR